MSQDKRDEKYRVRNTKISPDMDDVLQAVCKALDIDVYHLLQWFCYTIIRAASPRHELSPDIERIMTMMESDVGWQHAFNIANPAKLKIAQVVLILEQEGRKGFGAVMIDKPWMGQSTQTECVDDILERVTEVTMRGIHRRLKTLGAHMQCSNLSDLLITMIDEQMKTYLDDKDKAEMLGPNNIADNGKPYYYGRKTKSVQHRTPDSVSRQLSLSFEEKKRQEADYAKAKAVTDAIGCDPFGIEP